MGWQRFGHDWATFWRRQWHPTPVLLPGKSHGRRSPVGCRPWGHEELDTTERLHFHFSLSCIGEGNGNPLPCSCLENPRDGGAWWAAVYGVAQSQTQLKRLSSSSSRATFIFSHEKEWNNAICSNMDGLDIIILSEVRQIKTNIIWYHLYVESKKKKDTDELIYKSETD